MGILSSKMEPLEQAKHYIEQLKDLKDRLDQVSRTLDSMRNEKTMDVDEYERLYEKEFEISISLYGLYEDIYRILDHSKTRDNEFVIKRMKQEVDKIFKPIIVEV